MTWGWKIEYPRFSPWRLLGVVLLFLLAAQPVWAATNMARANLGADPTVADNDLVKDSATITINAVTLALTKQARDGSGTVISGGTVNPGDTIYFLLHVNNPTQTDAQDVQVTDNLNEAEFTYVPGSLEWTTVNAGATDAAIWAGLWTGLSDNVGGPDDRASIVDTNADTNRDRFTVGAVTGQANLPVTVPAGRLVAFRFRVTVN